MASSSFQNIRPIGEYQSADGREGEVEEEGFCYSILSVIDYHAELSEYEEGVSILEQQIMREPPTRRVRVCVCEGAQ